MEIRTTYISDDGTEFDTEEECLEYEAVYKDTSSVILLDCNARILDLDDSLDAFNHFEYIHIVKEQGARLLLDYVENWNGNCLPECDIVEGHTYVYDEDCGETCDNYWVDIDEMYEYWASHYNAVKEALSKVG